MDLSSFPRSGQFVVSDYETRGGARKSHRKRTHKKKKKVVRKTRRTKKIIL